MQRRFFSVLLFVFCGEYIWFDFQIANWLLLDMT